MTIKFKEEILEDKYINSIFNEDVIKFTEKIKNDVIDLTITSPPYNVAHDYDNYEDNLSDKKYLEFLNNLSKELYRITKNGGRVCINVPFAIKNKITKEVSFLATKIASCFNDAGFIDFEMITWHKGRDINHFQGNNTAWGSWKSPSNPTFRPLGEVILIFSKITRKHTGDKENIDISSDEFKEWTKNIWYLDDKENLYKNLISSPNKKIRKYEHPAAFPVELIQRLIKLYSYKKDIIFDPFNGTGTTSLSAYLLDRKYIACEQSEKYCKIARSRIEEVKNTNQQKIKFNNLINQNDSKNSLNEFFPYKESFSPNLLNTLIDEFNIQKFEKILDPFIGTASSFIGNGGIKEIYGYDTNPLAIEISKAKLYKIEVNQSKDIKIIEEIINSKKLFNETKLPNWEPFEKYIDIEKYYYIKNLITELEKKLIDNLFIFCKTVIISNLEKLFDYKRDGNGIKYRKSKINKDEIQDFILELLKKAIEKKIENDKKIHTKKDIFLFHKSSLELKEIKNNSLDIIITSPPYANLFDYFEVYKMELWTGGYIKEKDELKEKRKKALRSNFNANINDDNLNLDFVNSIIDKINDKRTKKMLNNYFYDMAELIKNSYLKLKKDAWMFIVVGNSFYETNPIPTDNLLATIANNYGFNVEEIKKARTLKTSSQQMKLISENNKKYLRESIICLKK